MCLPAAVVRLLLLTRYPSTGLPPGMNLHTAGTHTMDVSSSQMVSSRPCSAGLMWMGPMRSAMLDTNPLAAAIRACRQQHIHRAGSTYVKHRSVWCLYVTMHVMDGRTW